MFQLVYINSGGTLSVFEAKDREEANDFVTDNELDENVTSILFEV